MHLPETFISLLYDSVVNPSTGKLNFVLLKKFIDVCTDTVLQEEKTSSKTMRGLLQNVPEEDSEILKKFSGEIEKKLSERYSSLQKAYRVFDQSKDGTISESEFIQGLV